MGAPLHSLDALLAEQARREAARAGRLGGGLSQRLTEMLADTHPEARACIDDTAPLVAVRGTRRSGKSRAFIRKMLEVAASVEHARVIYVNETLPECEAIAWVGNGRDGLLTLNEQYRLGGEPNHSKHTLTFPNGGIIRLVGADDMRQISKLRGIAPHLVVIDEAQKAPHLTELIRDSLGPAMMDHGGQIFMPGTPGVDLSGLFYDVTNEEEPLHGWSVHALNVLSNPFFGTTPEERFERTVARYCREQGLALDAPEVQREWFGRWVKEDARFVYAIHQVPEHSVCYAPPRWKVPPVWRKDKNGRPLFLEGGVPDFKAALKDLPGELLLGDWRFTTGCDLGYLPDPFAYVLWAWSWEWPELLEVASWAKTQLDSDQQLGVLTDVAEHVPVSIMTGDIGGVATPMGKGWSRRWNERFGYDMIEAEKAHKFDSIQLFNTDLRQGRIKLRRGSPLHEQMKRVRWLPHAGAGKMKEDPAIPNDLTDGGLYGHRHTFQHLAQKPVPKPPTGSSEYYAALEASMEQDDLDELEKESESYYD